MDTLILEDFRCFAGRHEVPIRPLTLLVGENSTGKTSFLAAVRAAHDPKPWSDPTFNVDPFHLGSYDQIANYRGGRAGRAREFVVGQRFTSMGEPIVSEARFSASEAQPEISCLEISAADHTLQLRTTEDGGLHLVWMDDGVISERDIGQDIQSSIWRMLGFEDPRLTKQAEDSQETSDGGTQEQQRLMAFAMAPPPLPRPLAFAPLRASPRRTYDPIAEVRDPEGSHVPMMLRRLLGNSDDSEFRQQLEDFGQSSGLYSSVNIRKLGRLESDPFQIEVKPAGGGMARNLIDVGYGVSQAIPIIADCVAAEEGSTLLIQQPEVHLHPRAQAAMGSFFAQLASSGRNPLVVETHSDHLVDRVMMDVRDEKIRASDVMILYFEQGRTGVDIHPIEVDATGQVVAVPPGYRSFFLAEQRRFFGID